MKALLIAAVLPLAGCSHLEFSVRLKPQSYSFSNKFFSANFQTKEREIVFQK
jgi:hypothetical protein